MSAHGEKVTGEIRFSGQKGQYEKKQPKKLNEKLRKGK